MKQKYPLSSKSYVISISHITFFEYKRTSRIRKDRFLLPSKNLFSIRTNLDISLLQGLYYMSAKQTLSTPKNYSKKTTSNDKVYVLSIEPHLISISYSSEGISYIMVGVDAFRHYVALNPAPHFNAYFAYTTLYKHWIAKFGLPEIFLTNNGTEFINNEMNTLCHHQISNIILDHHMPHGQLD